MPFVIDKFKFKNGASVSEEFALFSKQYTRRGNSNTFWGNFYLRIIKSKIQVSAG